MVKQYFQQAWAQLRQHPIISVVNVGGTALAIFLIMLVVMQQQVKVAPFAPESNRDRFLHAQWLSLVNKNWGANSGSNGPMSAKTARELYQSLKTPEAVTIYTCIPMPNTVSMPGKPSTGIDLLETDDVFWRVFDFSFVEGKPYDNAMFEAGQPVAVMTESVARKLFGATDVVGKEFLLAHAPYRVCGVVKDVSTLATTAYGQVWVPFTSTASGNNTWNDELGGMMSCTILAKDRDDFDAIREEANRKLAEINKAMAETSGYEIISRNRPYDQEKASLGYGANYEPDVDRVRLQRYIIFLILLIVPAINLSSMTNSRLRQRVEEIGVRRAFGSTRSAIMWQLLAENFIVTLAAGMLGLLISVAAAYIAHDLIFAQSFSNTLVVPEVNAEMLLQADTFLVALLCCFVLNLLSTGIPAWRASRMNIVESLGGRIE